MACIGSNSVQDDRGSPNCSQILGKERREIKKVMAGGRRTLKEEREGEFQEMAPLAFIYIIVELTIKRN